MQYPNIIDDRYVSKRRQDGDKRPHRRSEGVVQRRLLRKLSDTASSTLISCDRGLLAEIEKPLRVFPQHCILFARRQEQAVLADIVDALPIGAETLDVRHVGAPQQLVGAEKVAHAEDEFLASGYGYSQTPPHVMGNMISISRLSRL